MTTTQSPKKRPKTLLLIDAYNLIYRAYHVSLIEKVETREVKTVISSPEDLVKARNDLAEGKIQKLEKGDDNLWYSYHIGPVKVKESPTFTRDGMANAGIFTVGKMLKKLRKEFANPEPGYCLAVFDGGGDNFRKDLDENYKANRAKMPDALREQMPYIEKIFEVMGFPITRPKGIEADDLIGALAKRAGDFDYQVDIISMDKDFRQIATDKVRIHDTMNDVIYDKDMVWKKNEVGPENIIGYLALTGDGVDNVDGVAKWGHKTAVKYLNEYGSLENLIANADKITGVAGKNLQEAIADGRLELYRKLVTINLDVPAQYKNSDMTLAPVDVETFDNMCDELSLYSLRYNKYLPDEVNELKERDKQYRANNTSSSARPKM